MVQPPLRVFEPQMLPVPTLSSSGDDILQEEREDEREQEAAAHAARLLEPVPTQSPIIAALRSSLTRHVEGEKLDSLLSACTGSSDAYRMDAVASILDELAACGGRYSRPSTRGERTVEEKFVANILFDQLYDFEVWYEPLHTAGITMNAYLVPLTHEFVQALAEATSSVTKLCWEVLKGKAMAPKSSWILHPEVWDALSDNTRTCLSQLALRLSAGDLANTNSFVKLSTRSPKDSLVLRHREEHLQAQMTANKAHALINTLESEHTPQPQAAILNPSSQARKLPKKLQGKVSAAFLAAAAAEESKRPEPEEGGAGGKNGAKLSPDEEEQCRRRAMVCSSGWEALDLLCSSLRIAEDLAKQMRRCGEREGGREGGSWREGEDKEGGREGGEANGEGEGEGEGEERRTGRSDSLSQPLPIELAAGGPLHVVQREWVEIPRWTELRGFIVDRQLTALSQYFTSEHFPLLFAARDTVAQHARTFVEKQLGPAMPMPHAVVDLAWVPERKTFVVIELNPFGRSSGAALFSWKEDAPTLLGRGPFQCRVSGAEAASRSEAVETARGEAEGRGSRAEG